MVSRILAIPTAVMSSCRVLAGQVHDAISSVPEPETNRTLKCIHTMPSAKYSDSLHGIRGVRSSMDRTHQSLRAPVVEPEEKICLFCGTLKQISELYNQAGDISTRDSGSRKEIIAERCCHTTRSKDYGSNQFSESDR
eukprot:scpid90598/ scgid28068/ 